MDPKLAANELYKLLMECKKILKEIYPRDNENIFKVQLLIKDILNHIRSK